MIVRENIILYRLFKEEFKINTKMPIKRINKKYKLVYQEQVVIEDFPYDVKLYKRVSK